MEPGRTGPRCACPLAGKRCRASLATALQRRDARHRDDRFGLARHLRPELPFTQSGAMAEPHTSGSATTCMDNGRPGRWVFDSRFTYLPAMMKIIATISGLLLPSVLSFSLMLTLTRNERHGGSGEAAAGLLVGDILILGLALILGCILNIVCMVIAAKRKEPNWEISGLGIPLCLVLSATLLFAK